jgi:23S rRNA pseudouridine955/2504/2580 synthase
MTDQVRLFTVTEEDDGIRLDRWFKRNLAEISFGQISRWARTGQLRLDGKRATPGDRILAGQSVRVPPQSEEAQVAAAAAAPAKAPRKREELTADEVDYVRAMVIHEDRAAIVVNKPPGLATQGGTKTNDHLDRLLDGLADEGAPRPKLVHRLDKDTSGALLVARTPRAAAAFSKSFSSRTARKVYWAIVTGVPSIADGMIDLPLAKQPGTGGEKVHVDEEEGQPARTRYRVIERAGNRAAWVELQPMTGRTHQLRVHMLAIGHPILGDGKYGGQDAFLTGAISRKLHLHARRLRIDHPDGGQIDVTAELPEHFAATIESLGFDPLLGEQLPLDEVKYSETPEGKRKAVSAAAKARRKDRKGERRSRGRG